MASGRIKGLTIEIGGDTTKLDKALGGVEHNLFTIQKDLQAVEKRLKLDPTNTELLAQKQRLLGEVVSETARKLKMLDDAADGVQKSFSNMDIDSGQLQNFNLEVGLTESDLKSAERALADFNDELKKTDGPAGDAADSIGDVGDAAEEAAGGLGGMGGAAGGVSGSLGGLQGVAAGAAIAIGQTLANAAIEAVKWMWTLDEATEEYRVAMGKLNTAYEASGLGAEAAKEAYQGFYNILGDTDTATEASQLLAQLVEGEKDITNWTEIAAGVYGTFGDSIPIEGLIEAANETAKTGKVTGVLADALNWVGISEDDFNKTLEQNIDAGDRAKLIMETLGRTYQDAAEAFYENNEALIASREAQSELDESLALIGESVANVKTELLDAFGPGLTALAKGAAGAFNGVAVVIRGIGDLLGWLGERIQDVIGFFQDLVGASNNASSASTGGGGVTSRAVAEPYMEQAASPYVLRTAWAQELPHLARGTVTRPNSPFLAVVGDNTQEAEVVSPYSTIKQAVQEAIAASGGRSGPISVYITFGGDLAQLARIMVPQITVENQRLGPQLVN